MLNPDNWPVEFSVIEKFEAQGDNYYFTTAEGWTSILFNEEAEKFEAVKGRLPEVGDSITTLGGFGQQIRGIGIAGVNLRYVSRDQAEQERQEWLANYDREKVETYFKMKDEWQDTVNSLHPVLKARIRRFEAEKGAYDFWKNDGGYELAALSGADALLKWADTMGGTVEEKLQSLDWWWSLNTAEHDYDYKRQKELIPDFGDGHSGNTAGAAFAFAKAILKGEYTEPV